MLTAATLFQGHSRGLLALPDTEALPRTICASYPPWALAGGIWVAVASGSCFQKSFPLKRLVRGPKSSSGPNSLTAAN
jgi:hypothetical protein